VNGKLRILNANAAQKGFYQSKTQLYGGREVEIPNNKSQITNKSQ
jgi:hypothetical protein